MVGFNTGITAAMGSFSEFNALRKNQLLAHYEAIRGHVSQCIAAPRTTNKYRDYYFIAQFEIGQQVHASGASADRAGGRARARRSSGRLSAAHLAPLVGRRALTTADRCACGAGAGARRSAPLYL